MMIHKLGERLRKLYDAPGMNNVAMIHFIGIYYAGKIMQRCYNEM